ncbi:protease complex subunit PrcB family protein [Anaeromyxobacter oryzae]|uniref:PrcB C-terminal domain-containing protein n=1 Tax=Anaeromyxobacter oryzae TaxID=2918170 RepID=A0ABN6MVG5_9BACT|nr:protease complex subunit PrcB family protein [Anaeromyxobacter oryzae]BDG03794.1 hypothetical protein AMOR_27900 [Anaeromyxobacter oryzae]
MRWARLAAGGFALALLLGAEGDCGDRRVPVAAVRGGSQCPGAGKGPSATLVTSPEAWREVFPSPLLDGEAPAPPVDFGKDAVIVVAMGERPTGGWAVELARNEAAVKDGVVLVQVSFRGPAKDALVTQALTRPCLAVKVPRDGIRAVKVADEKGAIVASAGAR